MRRKCHYCPQWTSLASPDTIKKQGPLARLPHAALKVKKGTPLPLCVATRQGKAAQVRAERSLSEDSEDLGDVA